jgi:hypothetical protein
MELFIIAVLSFVIGLQVGVNLVRRAHRNAIRDTLERLQEEVAERIVKIRLEKHSGVIYVYAIDTDEFLGQGKDQAELEKVLGEKYPDKVFAASDAQLKEFGFSNVTF